MQRCRAIRARSKLKLRQYRLNVQVGKYVAADELGEFFRVVGSACGPRGIIPADASAEDVRAIMEATTARLRAVIEELFDAESTVVSVSIETELTEANDLLQQRPGDSVVENLLVGLTSDQHAAAKLGAFYHSEGLTAFAKRLSDRSKTWGAPGLPDDFVFPA